MHADIASATGDVPVERGAAARATNGWCELAGGGSHLLLQFLQSRRGNALELPGRFGDTFCRRRQGHGAPVGFSGGFSVASVFGLVQNHVSGDAVSQSTLRLYTAPKRACAEKCTSKANTGNLHQGELAKK